MVVFSTADKLVVIVGETGSGKSSLAMKLATQLNGEIICADSRTVYRGMDIGTAKPTKEDQRKIRHHLLDIINPDQKFSVAQFKKLANQATKEVSKKGKLPLLVGGTGLYVNSVIYDYDFDKTGIRSSINARHRLNPPLNNRLRDNTLVIGLQVERETLKSNIEHRINKMVSDGLVEEIKRLISKYPEDLEAFKAPGYSAFIAHAKGDLSFQEAKRAFLRGDLQLAKRQRTWFKRNKSIHWINNQTDPSYVVDQVTTFLNK